MKSQHATMVRRLLAAQIFLMFAASAHAEGWGDMFSYSGFGTVGGVHTSTDDGDYVSSLNQVAGAGRSNSWSYGVDTELGLQLNGNFTDQFSGVVQIIAREQTNDTFSPRIEWANLQYAFTPDAKVRVGRIALPTYMVSDTRLVGYSNPWILPPLDTYRLLPFTNSDGIDASYKMHFGDIINTVQVMDGQTSTDAYIGNGIVVRGIEAKDIKNINDTFEYGALTARASILRGNVTIVDFGVAHEGQSEVINFGAIYDPGKWFVQGEYTRSELTGIFSDEKAYYVTGGYRIGDFTPYATYAKTRPVGGDGEPVDNATTTSIGLRWDAMKNVDIKVQLDHINLANGSTGFFTNTLPALAGQSVNVVNVAVDFVF